MKTMATAVAFFVPVALAGYSYHLSGQLDRSRAALKTEQATGNELRETVEAIQANDSRSREVATRLVALEQQLRKKADEQQKQLRAATQGNECADTAMPAGVIDILRQPAAD